MSAAPPVFGASGIELDLMSQLLSLMMVFFKASNSGVPGFTRLASACPLAYCVAAARFADVNPPPFAAAYANNAFLYFVPQLVGVFVSVAPPLYRSMLSANGFT